AAADRGEGEGLLDARLPQRVAVEADAPDGAPLEAGAEPAEGGRVLVDDGDVVALLLQAQREPGAHPAAAHDHEVHSRPSGSTRRGDGAADVGLTGRGIAPTQAQTLHGSNI